MSEEELSVTDELDSAVEDFGKAVNAKIEEDGDWEDMIPHLKIAKDRLSVIITTLEEREA